MRGAERGDPLPLPRDEAGGVVPTEGRPLYKRQRFQRDFTSAGHVIVMTWESTVAWGHSGQCRNSPDKQTVRCSRDPVEMKIHEAVGGQGVTGLVCGPVLGRVAICERPAGTAGDRGAT